MTPCDFCPIRIGCDYLSGLCRLSPREIVTLRPDIIGQVKIVKPRIRRLTAAQKARRRERRRSYFAQRYQANRDEMLAAAKANQREKQPWRKLDRREYFRKYYQSVKHLVARREAV